MNTRHEVIAFCLTLPDSYEDYPFHDANWTVMRYQEEQQGLCLCIQERWADLDQCEVQSGLGGGLAEDISCGNASVSYEQTTLELHHFGRFHGRSGCADDDRGELPFDQPK